MSEILAKYTDRTGKEKKCIIRAFVPYSSGTKAVIEMEDTHSLNEMPIEFLHIIKSKKDIAQEILENITYTDCYGEKKLFDFGSEEK